MHAARQAAWHKDQIELARWNKIAKKLGITPE